MAEGSKKRGGRQQPIPAHWIARVKEIAVNEPDLSGREIEARLKVEASAAGRTDYPRERRIRQIKASITGAERVAYSYVRWPTSFGTPDLPWEAGASYVDLRALFIDNPAPGLRPTVRLVTWFYRVTLAVPDLYAGRRYDIAQQLVERDIEPPAVDAEGYNGWDAVGLRLWHLVSRGKY